MLPEYCKCRTCVNKSNCDDCTTCDICMIETGCGQNDNSDEE